MVAEIKEITSLQKPPEGWQPSPLSHTWASSFGRAKSEDGPRDDAESTADLPELTIGLSVLPARCSHCGSALLTTEPPLDGNRRGMITCGTCGRQVCWLTGEVGAARAPAPSIASRPELRPVVPGGFEWLDGCGPACSIAYGHDPKDHEIYGRETAFADMLARPVGQVSTGRLTIDFDTQQALVDGSDIGLTPSELRIVGHLAACLGMVCTPEVIVTDVWGARRAVEKDCRQLVRVNVARIRDKLGVAKPLLETRRGQGILLRAEPPTETSDTSVTSADDGGADDGAGPARQMGAPGVSALDHVCGAAACTVDWLFEPHGLTDPDWRARVRDEFENAPSLHGQLLPSRRMAKEQTS